MLHDLIAFFLGISILFYCLLGGADYGGGILELFSGRRLQQEQKEIISHAIGPVWEANHVWLILAVVILFNGFPTVFSTLCVIFHIPITLMLIGIIFRGCAFTFRKYDAIQDRSQIYYSAIFKISSLITPFMLGIIAGGLLLGRGPTVGSFLPNPLGFYETYVAPWLNPFCFSVGLFTCILFAFLSAVYLIGETDVKPLQRIFLQRARVFNILAIVTGPLVFASAQWTGLPLFSRFVSNTFSLGCMGLATLLLFPLWMSLKHREIVASRILAGGQVSLILLGWFKLQYPAILTDHGSIHEGAWTLFNTAAPDSVLIYLAYALIGGSLLIFPALFFLLKVMKMSKDRSGSTNT